MSKRGYISRYLLLLKKLKLKPYSTYKELLEYIDNQAGYMQMQDDELYIGFSKRTFWRDKKEISKNFGIDIEYSRSQKGYFINQNENENLNFQRMMEAFDMFNSLNLAKELTPYVLLEKRPPQGTENIAVILKSIKNRNELGFDYHKFWEESSTNRIVAPLALKEFKNRWYLMAIDKKDNNLKSFALDRLSALEISDRPFEYPKDFDVDSHFKYCYGIISPTDQNVEQIVLSFEPVQGKYIKTLPLHANQKILIDNVEELRIELQLFITHDLIMELLSYGDNLKVIAPKYLAHRIQIEHEKASKRYT